MEKNTINEMARTSGADPKRGTAETRRQDSKKKWCKKAQWVITLTLVFTLAAAFPVLAAEAGEEIAVIGSVKKLGNLFVLVIRAVGAIATLWGFLQIGQSVPSHDGTQRVQGILFVIGGLFIVFSPEILNWIAPGALAGMM